MRRLAIAFVASGCLAGSAWAQPGNLSTSRGEQFPGASRSDEFGRPDLDGELSPRSSLDAGAQAGSRGAFGSGDRFGAGRDPQTSGGGFGQRSDTGFEGTRLSSGSNHLYRADHQAGANTPAHNVSDQAFDPETGGLTAEGRAELMLRNRLAAIGRLRDAALEVGDTELLQEADRLEQQARMRFPSRGPIAGPPQPPVSSAAYEFEPRPSAGVMPASGHPLRGFETEPRGPRDAGQREFGSQPASPGGMPGGAFGSPTAHVPSSNRAGETVPAGHRMAGEWYDVQEQARPRRSQPPQVSTSYGDRGPSRAAAEFDSPQPDSRFEPQPAAPADPAFEPNPFEPADQRAHIAPSYDTRMDAPTNTEAAARAFDRHIAAESRLHGAGTARSAAAGSLPQHPLRSNADRSARQPGQAGYQAEDDNTIYFGRPNGTAAAPGARQSAAARTRTAERQFNPANAGSGQGTADRGAAGSDFGQTTAAEARARGRADAHAEVDRFDSEDEAASNLDEPAESQLDADLDARPEQSGPAQPSSPSRTEEKPRKRGLFSWFRGREKTESR